jgi:multiple sugar transport system permease protein
MINISRSFKSNLTGYAFISPWILGFIIFAFIPMIISFYLSFTRWTMLSPPQWVGVENYQNIFTEDPLLFKSLFNTFYFVLVSVPLSMIFALFLAILLNQKVKGLSFFRTIFFLPSITNVVAVSVLWVWIFNPEFGLLNTVLQKFGIIGPYWFQDETWSKPALVIMSLWNVGGGMIIYLAALQGVPDQLYEAAVLDGAGAWTKFRKITIPMISPAIFFNLIISVIGSFQVFTQAFVMTGKAQPGAEGGPNYSTLFFVLYLYKKAFQEYQMGYASALAWILFLIILIFTVIQFKIAKNRVYYESVLK